MHLFGKSKKKKEEEAKEEGPHAAITKLKGELELLEKRKQFIEMKVQKEVEKAKELLKKKDKKSALTCMKRKAMLIKQADTLEAYMLNMDSQIMEIEHMQSLKSGFSAQKVAVKQMKKLKEGFSAEDVDDVMADMQGLMEDSADVQNALTAQIAGQDLDDDDLLAELDGLEQEAANESLGEVPAEVNAVESFSLPAAPHGVPNIAAPAQPAQAAETDEERELRLLEASMS